MLKTTNDASNTLYSERYQQTYHSTFGAVTESMHVFIHGAGVSTRLQNGRPTRVLEIGFGLGLNCLLCADSAESCATQLHYVGIEHDPITAAQFQSLGYQQWISKPALVDGLTQLLTHHSPDTQIGPNTNVALHVKDATSPELLDALCQQAPFDAIFLDAFSPDSNPECWTQEFFHYLHRLLAPHGQLATYCVKGTVRRNLEAAGFKVEKYPGPPGKREVLRAF